MRFPFLTLVLVGGIVATSSAMEPQGVVAKPDLFPTLINPDCSHCRDEAKRRATELKPNDRVLAWTRGYSEGGAIPYRFFLNKYRVISDSYGVFVQDADAGFSRGFAPSYQFRFHGWSNGIMVMKHQDGTLYSALSGLAIEGPNKGNRLKPIPTLTSDWGWWLEHYPDAVAYHMFEKYQPVTSPSSEHPDSLKSRGKPDPRLTEPTEVLGVWSGKLARAYPISSLQQAGFIRDTLDDLPLVVLWEPTTKTASAYRPLARQPRKFKAPRPNEIGVSPPDMGMPIPPGTPETPARSLTLRLAKAGLPSRFQDEETRSYWDVTGRCISGELKGYTLDWVDSVQVKWFAWSAEYPKTSIYADAKPPADANEAVKEVAGTAEFLRLLPKPFATLKSIDPVAHTVTLVVDGEIEAKTWPLEPDAEVKVKGWWGRLEQFKPGDRVWVWQKLNRQRKPVSLVMIADDLTEFDMHGSLKRQAAMNPKYTPEQIASERSKQQAWLRKVWTEEGLPGTLAFHHVFSGELDLALDHEAMRWGRSLKVGSTVQLQAKPAIRAVVKSITPWRERTMIRLVVGELESSDLKIGQRLKLKMPAPAESVETSIYPSDMDRPRSKAERIDWFLASIYCTCGVSRDICTGHFYTLSSCNPNGCGMPNERREDIAQLIDKGLNDRQIFDQLLKESGPLMLRPHLMP